MQFIRDDGGREAAGFRGSTRDCVVRAIAIAAQLDYREVYDELYEGARAFNERLLKQGRGQKTNPSPRTGVRKEVYKPFLDALGWEWTPTMFIGKGCKVHVRADELPPGRLILRLSRHIAAFVDGKLRDTYDCSRSGTRCVYGYWQEVSRG